MALLGLSDTDMVLNAAPPAAAHDRVFLTSGATSPKLPEQVPDYLFLACFGDNVQAAAGAEWAYNELDARKVAVLYDASESYPILLHEYFVTAFESLGGTVTLDEIIDPQANDLSIPDLGDVDLLFLSLETADDAARVIPLVRESGYTGPILGGDGYDAESVWDALTDVKDVYFTTHVYLGADNPNPRVGAFLDAYAAAYPDEDPSAFAALGYDAVGLLTAAMENTGEATPKGVLDGLAAIDGYEGVTGTISFSGEPHPHQERHDPPSTGREPDLRNHFDALASALALTNAATVSPACLTLFAAGQPPHQRRPQRLANSTTRRPSPSTGRE